MCTWYEYNHSACKATTHGAFAHHPLASAHHPLSFFSLYLRSSFLFWPLIFVLCPPLDSAYHPLSSFILWPPYSDHHPLPSTGLCSPSSVLLWPLLTILCPSLASAHHPLSSFSLCSRSSFLFWPLITVLLHNPLDSVHHPLSSLTSTHHPLSSFSQGWASVLFKRTQRSHILLRSFKRTKCSRVCILYKKNAAFFVFFYILYKRTLRSLHSLRSFTFFIKECSVVCILLRSL